MKINPIGYVSVIALSFIEPILRLLEDLNQMEPREPNEVKTNFRENGYSTGVIVLSVLLLESAINRTRYVREEKIDRKVSTTKYFQQLLDNKQLIAHVNEIFAIRDAIVHNHLWLAEITWNEDAELVFTSLPELIEGSGNERFRKVLEQETRLSKILNLNLLPTRIWRKDAYKVLEVVYQALAALEGIDRRYFYISPQHFEFQGKLMPLDEILASLS